MNMSTASRYPHYYLADVPHDLRRRVLDLCIHRQWQDAQDLLCAHSFRQYTLADLQSFYDWAPTILEQPYRSADSLSACPPSTDAASNDIQVARGARVAVASERRQLPTAPPSEPSHAASPEVSPPPPPGKLKLLSRARTFPNERFRTTGRFRRAIKHSTQRPK